MTTAADLVNEANAAYADAKARADEAISTSNTALSNASAAVAGLRVDYTTSSAIVADVVTNDVPTPVLPTTDFSIDVKTAFDHAFGSFNETLKPQILDYLTEFFPDIAVAVKTGSDQWIIDTIENGRYVPVEVENAIWNRARDKEVQDGLRIEQSMVDAAAARGWSLPPGVMAFAVASNQQDTQKRLTTINRDIAIKNFEVANENTKFAVQQAINLRTAFVGALADFIRTAMVQPNQAVDYAKTILAAKTGLYDSAVRLYSASIAEEELRTSVQLKNRTLDLQASDQWYRARDNINDSQVAIARVKADAAISSATLMSNVAAAALATRNTMISASAGI